MSLSPGMRLGPYEIAGFIGAGGMGEVYRARDTRLDRTVAVKILRGDVAADLDRRARFEREAKSIGALAHPNICTLYDVGDHGNSMFLVMEHLVGETLAQRLERGALTVDTALTIAWEIADALAAAHRQGIIHRDLKPANVMLTRRGACLLDFGLAKLAPRDDGTVVGSIGSRPTKSSMLTGEGTIAGTLPYMAPEQIEGRSADARSDLWALGAMLYEMLAGRRPFEGASPASLIGSILERDPAPLITLQPAVPHGIDRLIRQCLAKNVDDRPDTARDFALALRWLREPAAAPLGSRSSGVQDPLSRCWHSSSAPPRSRSRPSGRRETPPPSRAH